MPKSVISFLLFFSIIATFATAKPENMKKHVTAIIFQNQIAVRDKQWKYLRDSDGSEHLFDLIKDPYKQENIIAENQKQAQIMTEEYEKFIQRIELKNDE